MPHTEKRGNGPRPWRVKYKLPNGEWTSKSGFETDDDAYNYGLDQESDIRRGVFIDPSQGKVTVRQYAEAWVDSLDVGPGSMRAYRARLRTHILPRWGDSEIRSVTGIAFRTWIKDMRQSGKADNTVQNVAALMRTMLDDAVTDRMIPSNPAQQSKKNRRGRHKSKRRKPEEERVWATSGQVAVLASNAREIRGLMGYALVLTLAYTGMRIGELTGLRRTDCRLLAKPHEQYVKADFQMQYIGGTYTRVDAKYDSGRRLVIPPFLGDVLAEVLASHNKPRVFLSSRGGELKIGGGGFYESWWRRFVDGQEALPSRRGHPARPQVLPVVGLEGMTPHGLRHGHKVWLDEDGHPRVAVEARMGHEIPGVEGVYSHVSPEMERRISEKLQERWEQSQSATGEGSDAAAV